MVAIEAHSFEQLYGHVVSERVYPLVEHYDRKLKRTVWMETHPDTCRRGHDWTKPRTVLPRHRPCGEHRGHRTWACNTDGCDEVFVDPPVDETCS